MLKKKIARCAIALPLIAGSAIAGAAEPTTLSDKQMDTVAAGTAVTVPTPAQLATVGALAWAMSSVSATPGAVAVIEGSVTARVGLAGNGTSFSHSFRIVRPT